MFPEYAYDYLQSLSQVTSNTFSSLLGQSIDNVSNKTERKNDCESKFNHTEFNSCNPNGFDRADGKQFKNYAILENFMCR